MDGAKVTREDILKFPFPYKLWVIVNLPAADFLCWSFDGDGIIIYFKKLQSYLQSQQSIFVIKSAGQFVQHLKDFQFKSEDLGPTTEVGMYFHHPDFKRKRLDLVSKIRRENFFNLQDAKCAELENASTVKPQDRTKTFGQGSDLCHMKFGEMSKAKLDAIKATTLAKFNHASKMLQEKLKINEELLRQNSNKRGRSACMGRLRCVDIPEYMFVNPYESTLAGIRAANASGYAGFYGNYTNEQLQSFFGNDLPKYDENGVLAVETQEGGDLIEREPFPDEMKEPENVEDLVLDSKDLARTSAINLGEIPNETSNQIACDMKIDSLIGLGDSTKSVENLDQHPLVTFSLDDGSNNAFVEAGFQVEDFKMASVAVVDQVLQDSEPNQRIPDNQEFYDDLRATFELLQNSDI